MRGATKLAVCGALLLLASCQKRVPDFTLTAPSPDGRHKAFLRGFEGRGTIEGFLLLSFDDSSEEPAQFRYIKNGRVGWVAPRTLVIVADELDFDRVASSYFPDGTVESEIRVIVCARENLDCSALAERLDRVPNEVRIARFRERWY